MADALWPVAYPVLAALATWWGAPVAVALILAALAAGAGLGAAGDWLTTAVRKDLVTAALTAEVLVLALAAPDYTTSHRTPKTTPGGTR